MKTQRTQIIANFILSFVFAFLVFFCLLLMFNFYSGKRSRNCKIFFQEILKNATQSLNIGAKKKKLVVCRRGKL